MNSREFKLSKLLISLYALEFIMLFSIKLFLTLANAGEFLENNIYT